MASISAEELCQLTEELQNLSLEFGEKSQREVIWKCQERLMEVGHLYDDPDALRECMSRLELLMQHPVSNMAFRHVFLDALSPLACSFKQVVAYSVCQRYADGFNVFTMKIFHPNMDTEFSKMRQISGWKVRLAKYAIEFGVPLSAIIRHS